MQKQSNIILASVLGAFAAQGLSLRMIDRPYLHKAKGAVTPSDIEAITKAKIKRKRKAAKLARDNDRNRAS